MGTVQRKHSATQAWKTHFSITRSSYTTSGWIQLCNHSPETVCPTMIIAQLSQSYCTFHYLANFTSTLGHLKQN